MLFFQTFLLVSMMCFGFQAKAAAACEKLASQAEAVQEKFSVRCKASVAQKNGADGGVAAAGKAANSAAVIKTAAQTLGKVAGFTVGTAFGAWGSCRTALATAKGEIKNIGQKVQSAKQQAIETKDEAEMNRCADAFDRINASVDKIIGEYKTTELSLSEGMSDSEKAAMQSRVAEETAGGMDGIEAARDEDMPNVDSKESNAGANASTAMMAANLAKSAGSTFKGSGSGSSSDSATGAGTTTQSQPSQTATLFGTQTTAAVKVEDCTTPATGLGTVECSKKLAEKNAALFNSANTIPAAQSVKPSSIDTSELGSVSNRQVAAQSAVGAAYSAGLLKVNSDSLKTLCSSNELVGCGSL